MSSLSFALDQFYITKSPPYFFATLDHKSWMSALESRFAIQPLSLNLGRFQIMSLAFDETAKVSKPSSEALSSEMGKLDLSHDEGGFETLITSMQKSKAELIVESSGQIDLVAKSVLHLLSQPKSWALSIVLRDSPHAGLSPPDSLGLIKTLLGEHKKTYTCFATLYPSSTHKLITEEHVSKLSLQFFCEFPIFEKVAKEQRSVCVLCGSQGSQLVMLKRGQQYELLSLVRSKVWKGSFKICYLAASFFESLTPKGITVSDMDPECANELLLKYHPVIKHLTPKLEFRWDSDSTVHLIHSWASEGTLQNALTHSLSLSDKDALAKQLLAKMHTFHQCAVHKDVNPQNFLVNRLPDGERELFINDFGSSALASSSDMGEVKTNSYNLAPELIKRLCDKHGHFWSESVPSDFTFEDWVLSERFQVGLIILEIYMGKNPYVALQETTDIQATLRAKYPLSHRDLSTLELDIGNKNHLEPFLSDEQRKILKQLRQKAFMDFLDKQPENEQKHFMATLLPSEADKIKDPTFWPSIKQSCFESCYPLDEMKKLIDPLIIDEKQAFISCYHHAFKRMQKAHNHEFYGDLAQIIAEETQDLKFLIDNHLPVKDPEIAKRIQLIYPLVDLDPSKRPSFKTIFESLFLLIG